jgi:hypothetical protein
VVTAKEFSRGPEPGEPAADDRDVDVQVLLQCRTRRDGMIQ